MMRFNSLLVGPVARLPWRVQTKLLLAFLAIVALLIALGAVGLYTLSGIGLAVVDQRGKLRPFRPQLVGDMAQHLAGLGPVGLQESLAQRRRYHALLSFGDIGKSIAHPMRTAALPAGAKHPPDCRFEPLMRIGNHQLHAAQPTPRQASQKG